MDGDAWTEADPTLCPICLRESCEEHLPAPPLTDDKPQRSRQTASPLIAYTLPELKQHVFEYRRPLLLRGDTPILREGHLAEIYGPRGIGKTWFTQTLSLLAQSGTGTAMGFRAHESVKVLYIDGEMAGPELQERFDRLETMLGITGTKNLTILGADWQERFMPRLDTRHGQQLVEPFVAPADLVILDNRSTLFDPEAESDPAAWQPAQEWLLSLRRRRKAVATVHHANRQGNARGHSKPEDVMNLLLKLSRPEGYSADAGASFMLEFDKARGVHGADLAPFIAKLHPDGWKIEAVDEMNRTKRRLIEYLELAHKAGDRPKSASAAIRAAQVQKAAGLRVWAELKQNGLREHGDGGFFYVS